MFHSYHTTFEEIGHAGLIGIDVRIDADIFEGDPGCRYTPNGDGWPPYPAHAELTGVHVEKVYGDGYERTRDECGDWVKELDRIAEVIAAQDWNRLEETILEEAGELCDEVS